MKVQYMYIKYKYFTFQIITRCKLLKRKQENCKYVDVIFCWNCFNLSDHSSAGKVIF